MLNKKKIVTRIKENKNENNIFIDNTTVLKRHVPKAGKSSKIYYSTSKWADNKKMMQIMKII